MDFISEIKVSVPDLEFIKNKLMLIITNSFNVINQQDKKLANIMFQNIYSQEDLIVHL